MARYLSRSHKPSHCKIHRVGKVGDQKPGPGDQTSNADSVLQAAFQILGLQISFLPRGALHTETEQFCQAIYVSKNRCLSFHLGELLTHLCCLSSPPASVAAGSQLHAFNSGPCHASTLLESNRWSPILLLDWLQESTHCGCACDATENHNSNAQ